MERSRLVSSPSIPSAEPSTASANFKRLQARLRGLVGKAIADFAMIEPGDRVMVCLSGGKDSYTLLDLLISQQRAAPVDFELVAVNLDQKQPGFPEHVLPEYLKALGVPFQILEQDTYSVVKRVVPEGRTQCGLCSRLRRGALYRYAREHDIDKIALGHHRDDIVETLFLNLFHAGRLKAMAPKLLSEDGRNVVIRPLCYVPEREIVRYARARAFPIIPCTLCGSQPNLQRKAIARMLAEWEKTSPGRIDSIFHALRHVQVSQLVDPKAFDFASLVRTVPGDVAPIRGGAGAAEGDGDGGEDGAGDRAASDPAMASGSEADEAAADDARAEAAIRGFTPLEDWRERATLSPD
ncbi:MAG: tRNA 2-thiocytidine(32) synthetase TtcA [Deltaproteobacteria bacterium]|nr:tRNA 2-thiocytidine(32) synthetase TtcA [Deltaproteobacteria bacterium]